MSKKKGKSKCKGESFEGGSYLTFHVSSDLNVLTIKDEPFNGSLERRTFTGKLMYQVNFENGLRNGTWKSYHPNGNLHSSGKYINGQQNGSWVFYFVDETISLLSNFTKGKKDGDFQTFFDNGQISFQCRFENDEVFGFYKSFHKRTGKVKEVGYKFKNSDFNHCMMFDEDGILTEYGPYFIGDKIGNWTKLHSDGSIKCPTENSSEDHQTD